MATKELVGSREPLLDNAGAPLSGGSVDVFAPGTTTRITTYSDSGLTQENANPVPISGSGRASIWVNRDADMRILDKDGVVVATDSNVNPSDATGGFSSGFVPNGSFENDTNSDDVPDGWTNDVNETGSNNGLETGASNVAAGQQSWRTQSSGNGGGQLVTSSPFEVNDFDSLRVAFVLRSTVAAVRNIVRVEWYDVSDVSISNTDVYDSTSNPATFTQQNLLATPPSGARLARIRIIGGTTGGTLAGITYWDNFRVTYPEALTGSFDNITIQNNEIISTNTDGIITIEPNGAGDVRLGGNRTEVFADTISAFEIRNTTDGVSATNGGLNEGQSIRMRFKNTQDSVAAVIGFQGLARDLEIANEVWDGGVRLGGTDSAGGSFTLASFDPVTGASLNHPTLGSFLDTQASNVGGTVTSARVQDASSSLRDVGLGVHIENTVSSARSIARTDAMRVIRLSATANLTFDNDLNIPVGAYGYILNDSAGNITLIEGSGVNLFAAVGSGLTTTGNKTLSDHGWARWWFRGSGVFWITGTGIT